MSRRELGKSTIKEKIPEGSQYACRYWVHHLEQSGDYRDDEVRNCIYEFLRQYFLEWLEALSLIGQISECINLVDTLRRLFYHSGPVTDVAFSPDGKWLALASEDMTIRLWDIDAIIGRRTPATEKPIRVLRGHTSDVLSIAYSPDGKLLTSGSASQDDAVILWDETGSFESDHSRGCFNAITFSPSGKEVALSMRNGTIELWDVETGKEITTFGTHDKDVVTAAFSPDGISVTRW
ncbi:hypothetical protein TWF225_004780 [Orbilia oligospora]|nr:hypothetical protein TWF225_004780 [Orbilia oligospora]